jgi:DNA processing protein
MNESLAFHLLNRLPGCGAKTLRFLVGAFGSAQAAWEAPDPAWAALGQPRLAALASKRSALAPEIETDNLERDRIEVIPFTDPQFPALLTEIPDAPAILYVRGNFHAWNERPLIAIVGSRKFTAYGKQVTQEFSRALSQAGYVIVSGLAFGIDSIAHEATLDVGGNTLAILGSGIDNRSISPQSHLQLAQAVIEQGTLLSELTPGTGASVGTFPARNRIMAGMCQGVVVVEAAEESGSLITARLAIDYNREVFAVPGSIFSPTSAGTHALLKDGARLVTGIQDILAELTHHPLSSLSETATAMAIVDLSPDESMILETLSHEGIHIDNLTALVRLEATRVNMALTKLELRGLVKNIGNMHYTRGH